MKLFSAIVISFLLGIFSAKAFFYNSQRDLKTEDEYEQEASAEINTSRNSLKSKISKKIKNQDHRENKEEQMTDDQRALINLLKQEEKEVIAECADIKGDESMEELLKVKKLVDIALDQKRIDMMAEAFSNMNPQDMTDMDTQIQQTDTTQSEIKGKDSGFYMPFITN